METRIQKTIKERGPFPYPIGQVLRTINFTTYNEYSHDPQLACCDWKVEGSEFDVSSSTLNCDLNIVGPFSTLGKASIFLILKCWCWYVCGSKFIKIGYYMLFSVDFEFITYESLWYTIWEYSYALSSFALWE